jgi:hypothetical protein
MANRQPSRRSSVPLRSRSRIPLFDCGNYTRNLLPCNVHGQQAAEPEFGYDTGMQKARDAPARRGCKLERGGACWVRSFTSASSEDSAGS